MSTRTNKIEARPIAPPNSMLPEANSFEEEGESVLTDRTLIGCSRRTPRFTGSAPYALCTMHYGRGGRPTIMSFPESARWTPLRAIARAWEKQSISRAGGRARFRPTAAFDLGSANSRIAVSGSFSPIVIPSRIAVSLETDSILSVGRDALRMVERAPPSIRIESPIRAGVIASPGSVEALIRELLRQSIGQRRLVRPDFVMSLPASVASVHRHALVAVAHEAGARQVTLIDEGIAAALGADLPILEPTGRLIIEMGAEKTEIAVAALGGIVVSATAAVGGAHLSDAISHYVRRERHLMIGRPSADAIKLEIGSATLSRDLRVTSVRGHDPRLGLPSIVEVKSDELTRSICDVLDVIVAAIHVVLEKTPPELSADIATTGMHLSGGGSLLSGLEAFMESAVGLRAQVVDYPCTSVVRGCLQFAEDTRIQSEVLRLT